MMDIELHISIAFHPPDRRVNKKNHSDVRGNVRVYALDYAGSWEHNQPLIEFAYNNNYHASIGMEPYESLYSR